MAMAMSITITATDDGIEVSILIESKHERLSAYISGDFEMSNKLMRRSESDASSCHYSRENVLIFHQRRCQ